MNYKPFINRVVVCAALIALHFYSEAHVPEQLKIAYKNDFDAQSKEIIRCFLHEIGATQEQWLDAIRQERRYWEQEEKNEAQRYLNNKEISQELKELCCQLLKEQKIDPSSIALLNNNEAPVAYAKAIGFSPDFFNDFTRDEIEAFLMHEIMHLLEEDTVIDAAMIELASKSPSQCQTVARRYIHAMCKFREKRADIYAGLTKATRARALLHKMKHFLACNMYNDENTLTHIPLKERVAYLTELNNRIES